MRFLSTSGSCFSAIIVTILVLGCSRRSDARISKGQIRAPEADMEYQEQLLRKLLSSDSYLTEAEQYMQGSLELLSSRSEEFRNALDEFQSSANRELKGKKQNDDAPTSDFFAKGSQPSSPGLVGTLLNPCSLIGNQFQVSENVNCTCSGQGLLSGGKISFNCPIGEKICVAGDICGVPTYIGTISILELAVENEICLSSFTAGPLPLGKFCIKLRSAPLSGELLSCQANLGGLLCLNCNPLAGGGANIDCSNVQAGAVATSEFIGVVDGNPQNTFTPFVPNFEGVKEAEQDQNTGGGSSWNWLAGFDFSKLLTFLRFGG